jgi:hypothetical protein
MRTTLLALAAAVLAPVSALAITLSPSLTSGVGEAGVFPTDGVRAVVPFEVAAGFEAVLSVSVSGDASGGLGVFADSLVSVEFGVEPSAAADVSTGFSTFTDFFNPASAGYKFPSSVLVTEMMPQYLIFEMPAGYAFLPDEELTLSYAFAAEVRPVSPVNPIPLPAGGALLLGALAVLGAARTRRDRA